MEGVTLGPYRILRLIGRGGSGKVYEAVDTRLKRLVAIKLLAGQVSDRLLREARIASSLEHANIVTVHAIEEVNAEWLIVMELVRGESLAEVLKHRRLSVEQALSYAMKIADALAAAHIEGIVHRDIKPSNVVVAENGSIKVLDFGLAGDVGEKPEGGTLEYASPEQIRGDRLDPRSDTYSLGLVLREMLGRRRLPPALRRVVARTLKDDPAKRFQGAADLKVALLELLEEREASRPFPAFGLAIVVIALGAAFVWWRVRPLEPVLTVRALTSMTGSERTPALSPDGERVSFAWASEAARSSDIYVQLVSGGDPLAIASSDTNESSPCWSPDGRRIAYLRELPGLTRQILVVPALGGEPVVVGEARSSWNSLAWSPDGKSLAVNVALEAEEDGGLVREGLALMSVETGAVELLTKPSGSVLFDVRPRFSPDGTRLAFERVTSYAGDGIAIGVLALADGTLQEHKGDGWMVRGIDWTADGRALVIADRGRLVRLDLDRVATRDVLAGESRAARPALAGTRMVYERDVTDWDVVSPDGGSWVSSTFRDATPRFSPDGSAIAFISDRTGSEQIWILDLQTRRELQLTTVGRNDNPSWSPDGLRIAYMCGNDDPDICVVGREGGFPEVVASGPSYDGLPSWSRDGRWIYFGSDRGGIDREEIWKVPAGGGKPLRITESGGSEAIEDLDGRHLFYVIHGQRKPGIWRTPIEGGESVRVVEEVVPANGWTLTESALFFVKRHSHERFTIERLDLGSGELTSVAEAPHFPNFGGIDVAPDESAVLYGRVVRSGTDIVLVESSLPF